MSKQASLFKFFGGTGVKSIIVNSVNNKKSDSGNARSKDAENIVLRDVKLLLKDMVQNIASSESCKKKAVSDESYSALKLSKWKSKFVFWDTKDGEPSSASADLISWLEIDTDKKFTCWVCRKYPSVANIENKVYNGTDKWHINYPIRHAHDKKHADCIEKYISEKHGTSDLIEKMFQSSMEKTTSKRHQEVEKLMRTAYMVVKEQLPFTKYPNMCKLQAINGLVLGENYLTDKACARFVSSIAKDLIRNTYNDICDARFVSILSDGSTDKGILEEEIVYARYVKNGKPETNLLKVQHPNTIDAAGIMEAIQEAIDSIKPENGPDDFLDNFFIKLVNANFDGASVMSGCKNGVQKRLKDIQPGLVYTHCVAHRLELAMLDALKLKDNYLRSFDENINGIFKFYYYSPKRRKQLKDMADEMELEYKQFGLLKHVRWLASRSRALNILENNYLAIVYDLESKSYGTDETASKARGFLAFFKKNEFLFYLHFFQDFVKSLTELSLMFQKDDLLICEVSRLLEEKVMSIGVINELAEGLNRLRDNLSENNSDEIIYKNEVILSHTSGRRDNIEHKIDVYFNSYTLKFDAIILETQIQLRKRFGDFEALPLNNFTTLFDFKLWPKSFYENRKWGFDILQELINYYKNYNFITEEEAKGCIRQWPLFRSRVSRVRVEKVYNVYVDMMQENENDMDCMLILLRLMMTISSSTCACERGFSCMNMQKSNLKISMSNATLNDVMVISVNGPILTNFDAAKAVDNWIGSGKRRLETGHKTGQKKQKKND